MVFKGTVVVMSSELDDKAAFTIHNGTLKALYF